MLQKILCVRGGDHRSSAEILADAGMATMPGRLAAERLLYACQLFCLAPEFLQALVHREAEATPNAWLLDPTFSFDLDDLTQLIDQWQSGERAWLRRVKKAWRFDVRQEQMMTTTQKMHQGILQMLQTAGAQGTSPLTSVTTLAIAGIHSFSAPQGLAAHTRLRTAQHPYGIDGLAFFLRTMQKLAASILAGG